MRKPLLLLFVFICCHSNTVNAQQSDPFAPAQPLADGWEKMDERLIFLMVRLVDVEANLDAVDAAIAKAGGRAASARSAANKAAAGNERMDRRAGGPVRWDQFYGRTAEKFFYHPTDNHTYHTQTILSQQSPSSDNQGASGVPSRQGLPVHQRPPQFDYMYRANENAKERATAEVAKIANKVDALAARRAELELDQCKLWCDIAFRVVSRNDLNRQPLYRFAPKGTGNDDLLAATTFVTTALSIVESGESDQASAFRQLKPSITQARKNLGDQWLRLGVKYQDEASNEWRFATLARYVEDVSSNLSDSYAISLDSARNSDADRRDMYRGLLQKSLVQYAEAVLALNEMATELANGKSFEPDLGKPLTVAFDRAMQYKPMNSEQVLPLAGSNSQSSIDGNSFEAILKRLQGKWRAVAQQSGGRDLTSAEVQSHNKVLTITGNRYRAVYAQYWLPDPSTKGNEQGTIVALNAWSKPAQIEIELDRNPICFKGIFEINGNRLRHCFKKCKREDDNCSGPTSFATGVGTEEFMTEYVRAVE